ncbi:hypothetical protein CEP54_013139 [Fusarium duplospermum]|uniref:Uncharacterized protein n=1 Tax=Fusarium duplospermum TaxID=1325734 RepID=A0A428P4P2_9HYPO|nr:hypothetical protein CEP54_013139 [Fusarium duplospermum]
MTIVTPIEDDNVTARDKSLDETLPDDTLRDVTWDFAINTFADKYSRDCSMSTTTETTELNSSINAEVSGNTPAALPSIDKPVAETKGKEEVGEFMDHRLDTEASTVEIQVKWEAGREVRVLQGSERGLREDVPTLVFEYLKNLGGYELVTGLEIYHIS